MPTPESRAAVATATAAGAGDSYRRAESCSSSGSSSSSSSYAGSDDEAETCLNDRRQVGGGLERLQKTSRKIAKPIMEKRRRARINASLNELKTLLVEVLQNEGCRHSSKMEKADILEMTVKHLRQLQRQPASGQRDVAGAIDKYALGYNECLNKVCSYLHSAVDASTTVDANFAVRLVNHLVLRLRKSGHEVPPRIGGMASAVSIQPSSNGPTGIAATRLHSADSLKTEMAERSGHQTVAATAPSARLRVGGSAGRGGCGAATTTATPPSPAATLADCGPGPTAGGNPLLLSYPVPASMDELCHLRALILGRLQAGMPQYGTLPPPGSLSVDAAVAAAALAAQVEQRRQQKIVVPLPTVVRGPLVERSLPGNVFPTAAAAAAEAAAAANRAHLDESGQSPWRPW